MKRDMDLMRDLMLKFEAMDELEPGSAVVFIPEDEGIMIDGYDWATINYHFDQIVRSGFLVVPRHGASRPPVIGSSII